MNPYILSFLKNNISSDTRFINRLFVTAVITRNKWVVKKNSLLSSLIIDKAHPDYQVLAQFIDVLEKYNFQYTFDDLISLFEFVISPHDKIVNGAVYTPQYIRDYIEDYCWSVYKGNIDVCRIIDLSCGCGGFLVDMARKMKERSNKTYKQIFSENIYGIDVQDYAIERTKILLSLLALSMGEDDEFSYNLWAANTLNFNFQEKFRPYHGFDIIIGNPPYVCSRNLPQETKEIIKKWSVCSTGHPDLYIPFFQVAIENLSSNGVMGYITMNSFLKSVNGRALREYFNTLHKLIHIIDFRGRQIFQSKNTYTCLFFAENKKSDYLYYGVYDGLFENFKYNRFEYSGLDSKKGWDLNETTKIHQLESVGKPIRKFAQSRHGLATLCNKVYIFAPVRTTKRFYILRQNGVDYPIEKAICKDIVNPNKFNSEVVFADVIKKIIFPYEKNHEGKMTIIPEYKLQEVYPCTYRYLLAQKAQLAARDKGKGKNYDIWYQFGRTQSLNLPSLKLLVPKIANRAPRCILIDNPNLYFYNGFAFVGENVETLYVLQKILESSIFWEYIVANSKPYSSDYYSISGSYIYNFGIHNFSTEEKQYLLTENRKEMIDSFLRRIYFPEKAE